MRLINIVLTLILFREYIEQAMVIDVTFVYFGGLVSGRYRDNTRDQVNQMRK